VFLFVRVPFRAFRIPFRAFRVPFRAFRVSFRALRVSFRAFRVSATHDPTVSELYHPSKGKSIISFAQNPVS
jgi:hypothetical protein